MSQDTHGPSLQRIATRDAILGEGMRIRRALPNQHKRMIGAWCFLDHAGPADVSTGLGMRVGPHPHIGLQTFTWMIEGEILHQDSLGYEQIIRPGQVNLMTAGRGISHAESSPEPRPPRVHAAQLWIALPDDKRDIAPAFINYPELPSVTRDHWRATVLVGEALGVTAPTQVYTPLVAIDFVATGAADIQLTLRPDFEYGVLVLQDEATIEGETLDENSLLYLGSGRDTLHLQAAKGSQLLLIGGTPFGEDILLWWNFVARRQDEIAAATEDWNHGDRFGQVRGYQGDRLTAPALPEHMKASS